MDMTHSLKGKVFLRPQLAELVINWHVTEACNYRCRYCYAHWENRGRELIHDDATSTRMLQELWQHFSPSNLDNPLRQHMDWTGVRLNLAGGEPLLYPDRVRGIIKTAREFGFSASVITNGSELSPELAEQLAPDLTILGVSLDSSVPTTNQQIGRQDKRGLVLKTEQLEMAIRAARRLNPKLQIKLNTVVNALNCQEDLSTLIRHLSPHRWKVLRMLPVVTRDLMVSDSEFLDFVIRHKHLGTALCVEDNTEMVESYVMIDPNGRFFQNALGQSSYRYSRPIPDVGVESAFASVGMDPAKFCARYLDHTMETAA